MKKIPLLSILLFAAGSIFWVYVDQTLIVKAGLAFLQPTGQNTITLQTGNASGLNIVDNNASPVTYMTVNTTTPAISMPNAFGVTGVSTLTGGLVVGAAGTTALTNVGAGLTALGAIQSGALALTNTVNDIATGAASTGVSCPAPTVGLLCMIGNRTGNSIVAYAITPATLNGTASATGITVANGKGLICFGSSTTNYVCSGI